MRAFIWALMLQGRLDLRSKTMLTTCYVVPLFFFALMGGIFRTILPESSISLISAMTVFGVSMGALIGLPPSLGEIYGSDVQKVYAANGVPRWLGLVLTNLSAALHLFCMSMILLAAAPIAFDARLPAAPGRYLAGLALFIVTSLGVASVIGLAVRDQAKMPMISIMVFLPSSMLSGIMFPAELLPDWLAAAGKLFPATWGYRLLSGDGSWLAGLPLLLMFAGSAAVCVLLFRRSAE